MAIKVVAFDVHNTLLHWPASRVQPAEVQQLLAEWGIDISYQAYEAARAAVLILDTPKREIEGWTDFLALLFDRMGVSVSVDLLTSLTAMHESRDGMVGFPEAVPVLQAARAAGLVTCTFTTLPRALLGRHAGGVLRALDHYFNCSTAGFAKGDRRYYRRITERLSVEPQEILCVGDDPVGDCLVPGQIGWQPVLLDRQGRHAETRVGQIATVRTLEGLRGLLPGQ